MPFTARAPTSIETARAFVRFVTAAAAAAVVVVARRRCRCYRVSLLLLLFSPLLFFFFSPSLFFSSTHALEMNPSRYVLPRTFSAEKKIRLSLIEM